MTFSRGLTFLWPVQPIFAPLLHSTLLLVFGLLFAVFLLVMLGQKPTSRAARPCTTCTTCATCATTTASTMKYCVSRNPARFG